MNVFLNLCLECDHLSFIIFGTFDSFKQPEARDPSRQPLTPRDGSAFAESERSSINAGRTARTKFRHEESDFFVITVVFGLGLLSFKISF